MQQLLLYYYACFVMELAMLCNTVHSLKLRESEDQEPGRRI